MLAAAEGHKSGVEALLDGKANPNDQTDVSLLQPLRDARGEQGGW